MTSTWRLSARCSPSRLGAACWPPYWTGERSPPRCWPALAGLGIDPPLLHKHRHDLRHCVDWSEPRHHLAGPVGSTTAERMIAMRWIEAAAVGRSVEVTDAGRDALATSLGLPTSVSTES